MINSSRKPVTVGSRVRWTTRTGGFSSHESRGVVTRMTDATLWVKPDGASDSAVHSKFRHTDGISRDVEPLTKLARLAGRFGVRYHTPDDLTLDVDRVEMSVIPALVVELAQIGAWIKAFPTEAA